MAFGPDGDLWTGYFDNGAVGARSANGDLTDHQLLPGVVFDVADGPGGVWFISNLIGKRASIVRLPVAAPTPPAPPVPVVPVEPGPAPVPLTPAFTG